MINIASEILEKHKIGLEAAYNYYVRNLPTGLDDAYYDFLESEARKDGLELRDYVCQEIQGKRSQNAGYIGKVEKLQVKGCMKEAILAYISTEAPEISYLIPKYDGSSLAAYYDPGNGKCIKVITIGGSNLGSEGIDQTEKFAKYLPDLPGTGICALQCECLVSLEHGLGEKSRQKANGLVTSSYEPLSWEAFRNGSGKTRTEKDYQKYLEKYSENLKNVKEEVDQMINLRCFRFFLDLTSPWASETLARGYKDVLESLPVVKNSAGDIKFCGGFVFEPSQMSDFVEKDIWATPTGTFLVDGVVGYTKDGACVKALKYHDAGRGESTVVKGIIWNDQGKKGKDSWSANALIDPINVRGTDIKKPTVGSIQKMIDTGLSKGARVTVILANSTIPQVSQVLEPGDLNFEWPTCGCGHTLGPSDIYGALAKCGNPMCTERLGRMKKYLGSCQNWSDVNLNKLLVIDRFDWAKKSDLSVVMPEILQIVYDDLGADMLKTYLSKYLTTQLQQRNLELVIRPAYQALSEYVKVKFGEIG